MADFKNISATTLFTIKGNDDTSNTLASIAEMQVKRIIFDNKDMLGLRADATAASVIRQDGLGSSIYRLAKRNSIGTDWDANEGIQRQRTASLDTVVHIDQHLTGELFMEEMDLTRIQEADPDTRGALVADWLEAWTISYLMSLDAIFIRGLVDGTTAFANKYTDSIFQIDPDKIVDAATAKAVYIQMGKIINRFWQMASDTVLGITRDRLRVVISPELELALTANIQNFIINADSFRPIADGKLFAYKIMGVPVSVNTMLGNKYKKGTPSQINKDLDFDFTNLHMVVYVDDAMVMPIGMEKSIMLLDNKTASYKWLMKNMGSVPANLRPELIMLGMATLPDDAAIKAAQGMAWDGVAHDYSKSFQIADYNKDFGKDGDFTAAHKPASVQAPKQEQTK